VLIGLLGYPLTASMSPRMQNAAFAECGLDWSYALVPVREGHVEEAVAGLADSGFAGANVTTPHKLAVLDFCETDLPSVNTLIVRDDHIEGHSTDAAVLDGLSAERPAILGDGGSAAAFRYALPHATQFSRRGAWPPDVREADLVVNTTSERDEVLAEVGSGQTLIDLPYPETATARAAAAAGAHVVTGLEVLVAQGAASFELWTGIPAPVDVMRRAVRSAA
jgi:shikimate dehydrogenase